MIGKDNKGTGLNLGDICSFKLEIEGKTKELEGIIVYDEESFSYAFEMDDNNFPMVLMSKAGYNSIEKIINVWSTKLNDRFGFYRDIYYKGRV